MHAATAIPHAADAIQARAARVALMIFDVDGVLTDGRIHYGYTPDGVGECMKVFNVLDGHGLKALRRAGVHTAIISGRASPLVAARARELDVEHVLQGISDKSAALDGLLEKLGLVDEQCGFMGDDVIDLPVMQRVGLAATVPNAADGIASHAHWCSRRGGGLGAVREVCELILAARGLGSGGADCHA